MEKVKALYEKVAADSVLQGKLKEILSTAEKDGKESTEAKLLAFAREAGFETTMEEVTNFFQALSEARTGELSEQELDMVAGGKNDQMLSAGIFDRVCVVANSRTPDKYGISCRDYL